MEINQETPKQEEKELTEALEDLGSIYLLLYSTTEPSANAPKVHEDPDIFDGIRKIYSDFTNPPNKEIHKLDVEQDLVVLRELEVKYAASVQSQRPPTQSSASFTPKTAAMYIELFGEQRAPIVPLQRAWTRPGLGRVLPIFTGGDEVSVLVGTKSGKGMARSTLELRRTESSPQRFGAGGLFEAQGCIQGIGFQDKQVSELCEKSIRCPQKIYQAGRQREGRFSSLMQIQALPQIPIMEFEMEEFGQAWKSCRRSGFVEE